MRFCHRKQISQELVLTRQNKKQLYLNHLSTFLLAGSDEKFLKRKQK
uniref:Uncharacterized protein n=1 Tax=Onchocerca volvulus TaxID=6282 RepID=A0A8R1TXX5_ONCVO